MRVFIILSIVLFSFNHSVLAKDKWYVPSEKDALKYFGQPGKAVVDKQEVSILIWNAHKEVYDRAWQQEFKQLGQGMDFLLLQESITEVNFWITKLKFPKAYSSYAGVAGFSFYYMGKFNGNVNLSHYKAQDAKVIHTDDREPVVNTVKPILVTRYRLPNGEFLTLANIHAINFVDWKVFARQITKGLKYLNKFSGPIVFGGDFNSWNKAKLDFLKSEMGRYGFSQVALRHPERVKKVFDFPIDHIFTRDADVLDADYLEHKTSDHTPMMVKLSL